MNIYSRRGKHMNRILLSLFLLVAIKAAHADQRLVDVRPGMPCDKVPEIEKRLGSLESSVDYSKGIMKYQGTLGGEKAVILYHCEKGKLTELKIIVANTTQEAALRFARAQKTELTELLGKPIHDGLDLKFWEKFYFGFMGADLDYLSSVVVWGKTEQDTMILIRETANNQWEVSVSRGSSKWEYILNS